MNPIDPGPNQPQIAAPPPPPVPPIPPNTPSGRKSGHWGKFWSEWTLRSIAVFTGFYITLMILTAYLTRESTIQFWSLWFFVAAGHFWKGLTEINEQMRGVLVFFGLMLEDLDSGPHLIIWPNRLRVETKNSIHVAFGTIDQKDRAQIEQAKRSDRSASWYVLEEPVRIKWGDMRSLGTEAEIVLYANDPDANTLTTDPHLYFRIKISSLKTLIEEVGGLEEAIQRIKDTCIRALSERAGKTFVAKARSELIMMSKDLKTRVENLVSDPQAVAERRNEGNPWGIDVEDVGIRDIGLPHEANKATADRSAAIAKADGEAIGKERLAKAIRKEKEEIGQGDANAQMAKNKADQDRLAREGKGRAKAIEAVNRASDSPIGRYQLSLDATVKALGNNSKIVIAQPGGATDLLGLVATGQALLEKPENTEPVKKEPPSK